LHSQAPWIFYYHSGAADAALHDGVSGTMLCWSPFTYL